MRRKSPGSIVGSTDWMVLHRPVDDCGSRWTLRLFSAGHKKPARHRGPNGFFERLNGGALVIRKLSEP
jgi:hypothetical protein